VSETYYEILGVEPDAARDQIRDAYRARTRELSPDDWQGDAEVRRERTAAVNKAWNVLSDPFQKERYDQELAAPVAESADAERADAEPAANAARGGRDRTVRVIEGPGGLRVAPARARINALTVDVAVILVIVFGLGYLGGALFSKDAVQVSIKGTVEKTVQLDGRSFEGVADQAKADALAAWKKDHKSAKTEPKVTAKKVGVVPSEISLAIQFLTLLLALGYTVPSTVRSGQTLGKRIFKIKVVSIDGSRVGWASALLHYGVPISLAIALALLGAVLAIGMVLWSMRDKAGQGIDDKLAKTFVVEA
jgi:curved DNA-binding protein CbpA